MMIVTVRLIRSFAHRNIKHIVYKDVDVTMLVEDFIKFIKNGKEIWVLLCYLSPE